MTDCVIAELEKLGQRYRVALRYAPEICIHCRHIVLMRVHIGWPETLVLSAFHARTLERMRMTAWFNVLPRIVVTSWQPVMGSYEDGYGRSRGCP